MYDTRSTLLKDRAGTVKDESGSERGNRERSSSLIRAPERVRDGGCPVTLSIVSLQADVLAAVVLDLVTGRVPSVGLPLLALLALLVRVIRIGARVTVTVMVLLPVVVVMVVMLISTVLRLLVLRLLVLVVLLLLLLVLLLLLLEGALLLLEANLLLRLRPSEVGTLLFQASPLSLKALPLLLGVPLGSLAGLLLAVVIVHELVGQEAGTDSQKTAKSGCANIGSPLLVLQRFHPALVKLGDMGSSPDRSATLSTVTCALAGDVVGRQGQVDLTLLLAIRGVDIKDAVHGTAGSVDDLVDGDGRKGNDSIGSGLLVHDLDVELGLALQREVEGLVPDGVLAGVLVDKSLLERLYIVEVERELDIGILLAKGLEAIKGDEQKQMVSVQ